MARVATAARWSLGGIRIVNGTLGLLAPALIIRRFGDAAPERNPAAVYGLRLFGIRTILIGADLVLRRGEELDRKLGEAVLVHGSDTATVLALRRSRALTPELARPLAAISGLNTVLAVTAFLTTRRSRS